MGSRRVAVVGSAGGVGSVAAATLVDRDSVDHLLLVDRRTDLVAVQRMDLEMLAAGRRRVRVDDAAPGPLTGDLDVVVLAASVPHVDGAPRADHLEGNLAIMREVVGWIPGGWSGCVVVASNPVDQLTTAARHLLPPEVEVVGYAANDSLRLAGAVTRRVGPRPVTAWAVGEHGCSISLFDRVGGDEGPIAVAPAERLVIQADVDGWYAAWQAHGTGLTSRWTTGVGLADLVGAVLADTRTTHVVSLPAAGAYGIEDDVCLSLPASLGAGRAEVERWTIAATEEDALRAAARRVAAGSS